MNAMKSNRGYAGKNRHFKMKGLLILSVLIIIICGACPKQNPASTQSSGVDDALERSADYFMKITGEDGKFVYRINMDPTVRVNEKYNILRHAGSIYALAMYYEKHPDEAMRSVIKRAGKYLKDESLLPVAGENDMLAVWSKPEVNKSGKPLQAKLGGTGLGLLALVRIENISPGFTPMSDLKALGRFIVYMQNEDGSFCSKYIPSLGGKQNDWNSLYYPGEAALGLLMLYEKDPSVIWLKSAYKALEYLARTRENSRNIPADHWALLATEKILSIDHAGDVPISKKLLVNHAVQICESLLNEQVDDPERPKYDGGYSADGRTTPTATRLEGLLSALSFLPSDLEIRKRIESSVPRGISFLVRAQIKAGGFSGAMPRAVGLLQGNGPDVYAFNRRAAEVRIDYIQHAMSAMMQFMELRAP